jgi:hypothetical protein
MVGTDEGRDWVIKLDWGSDLKGAGNGHSNEKPPYKVFPAAAELKSAQPNRVAPRAAAVLLVVGVELHPHR